MSFQLRFETNPVVVVRTQWVSLTSITNNILLPCGSTMHGLENLIIGIRVILLNWCTTSCLELMQNMFSKLILHINLWALASSGSSLYSASSWAWLGIGYIKLILRRHHPSKVQTKENSPSDKPHWWERDRPHSPNPWDHWGSPFPDEQVGPRVVGKKRGKAHRCLLISAVWYFHSKRSNPHFSWCIFLSIKGEKIRNPVNKGYPSSMLGG